jgi:predicted transcriptional regulator
MTDATSPLVRLLESEDRVRIMDVFIRRFDSELAVTDISERVDIDYEEAQKEIEYLYEVDFVKEPNSGFYKVNVDSELVVQFGQMHETALRNSQNIPPAEKLE